MKVNPSKAKKVLDILRREADAQNPLLEEDLEHLLLPCFGEINRGAGDNKKRVVLFITPMSPMPKSWRVPLTHA